MSEHCNAHWDTLLCVYGVCEERVRHLHRVQCACDCDCVMWQQTAFCDHAAAQKGAAGGDVVAGKAAQFRTRLRVSDVA